MSIVNPSEEVIKAVNSAAAWFEKSKITGLRYKMIQAPPAEYQYHSSEYDMIAVNDPDAPPVWARFYEPGTHRPLFCNRDGVIVYSLAEVERERRTGYAWYVYDPAEILQLYPAWKKKWSGSNNCN
jgi:PelA/Pel-15E family pectate lyase